MIPRRLAFLLASVALAALARGAPDGAADWERRLADLERQVRTLARENDDLRRRLDGPAATPAPAPVAGIRPAGKASSVVIGGFLQGQAEFGGASDPRWTGVRDRLFFRRARLHVAGSFTEQIDFKAELDFQGNTLGASTGNMARANEIFINWSRFEAANLRFGQLKPAFGAEALASDTKCLTIERSLASDRLTDGRQLAVGLAGSLAGKRFGYYAVLANGNGANVSANDNGKFQRSARVTWTPALPKDGGRLVVGLDGLWSEDAGVAKADFGFPGNSFTGRRTMSGVDVAWSWGRLDLNGEYLRGRFARTAPVAAPPQRAAGWQVTAAFFAVPSRLQVVARREAFDPNTAVAGNTFVTNTLGLTYLLKGDDLKFMVDFRRGRGPHVARDENRLLSRVQVAF